LQRARSATQNPVVSTTTGLFAYCDITFHAVSCTQEGLLYAEKSLPVSSE